MSYKNIVFVLYARQAHLPAPSPFGAHHVASLDRRIPRAGIGAGRGGGPGSAGTGRRRRGGRRGRAPPRAPGAARARVPPAPPGRGGAPPPPPGGGTGAPRSPAT